MFMSPHVCRTSGIEQMFKEEACLPIDLELANWWSCTYPKARFTSQFFVARVVGEGVCVCVCVCCSVVQQCSVLACGHGCIRCCNCSVLRDSNAFALDRTPPYPQRHLRRSQGRRQLGEH